MKPLNDKEVLSIMNIINGYSIRLKLLLFSAGSGLTKENVSKFKSLSV